MISTTKTTNSAENETERKAFFQPFECDRRKCCGAPRRRCSKCPHRFSKGERFTLECPECGHDRRCRAISMKNGRCKRHGGKVKSGTSAPNFKHGRYANELPGFPKKVQEAYAKAMATTEMQSVGREMGLVQARMLLLAESMAEGESSNWWRELAAQKAIIGKHRPTAQKGNEAAKARVAAAFERILELIESGSSEADKWDEILSLNKQSAELKIAQGKIERDNHLYLTATQAMNFVTVISRGVREALLLVRERWRRVRNALADVGEFEIIIDEGVEAIKEGEDTREVLERTVSKVIESVPVDVVDDSFSEANTIVQDRIRSMVKK